MSNYLKPLVVLLISVLIFAGIALLLDKDLLDFIQTRFYNPSIVKSYIVENAKDAELAQDFIFELQQKFGESLKEPAIRSSFLYNQSAEDIFERSRIYGLLMESTSGLQSVQFIDSNGRRIHYSTSFRDIISQSSTSTSYRNYTEDDTALPYDAVSVLANGAPKFSMDEKGDRIIFSYPFQDSLDIYHGTALFSVSIRALSEKLVSEGRLKVNESIAVIASPSGVLVGTPDPFKAEIQKKVSEVWKNGMKDRIIIDSEGSNTRFSLISLRSDGGIFFGRLVNDKLFYIPESMKIILYFSMFLTFYLALFFILNFKASPVIIIRNRIRNLREILFEQLHEDKSTQEKIRWLLELEQRRDEVRNELKYNLRLNSKLEQTIDGIINKSWDEIIAIIRASSGHAALALKIASLDPKELVQKAQEIQEAKTADKIEEAEAIEEVEALSSVEDIEELAEEVESIEELAEDVEEAEAVEEVSSIEEIEEVETIGGFAEEAEFVQDVEEISVSIDDKDTFTEEFFEIPKISSGGLLQSAKKYAPTKGLLQLASEFEIYEEIDTAEITLAGGSSLQAGSKGLLRLASEYTTAETVSLGTRGLLARALNEVRLSNTSMDFEETKTTSGRKGLLALASEIEFSSSYPVITHEIDDVETQDVDEQIEEIIHMDIVSPFIDMFSSLDNVKIEE